MHDNVRKYQIKPCFIESGETPIYALVCEPTDCSLRPNALIACHSYGPEQSVGARLLSLAARQAASFGFTALAFHGRGHGDSAGDFADVTFDTLIEDALAAADQISERGSSIGIVWLGLRFGALVAAAASARHANSKAIVLWEPVHSGTEYVVELIRGLQFSELARGKTSGVTVAELIHQLENKRRVEVLGSFIHPAFYKTVRKLWLSNLMASWVGPTLIAQIQPRMRLSPPNRELALELTQRGSRVDTMLVREAPGWQFPMWRQPWISPELLAETGAWLDALA
jgi:pimeloyl-ACP methyl ester carboxylesterase